MKVYKITRPKGGYCAFISCYSWLPSTWEYVAVEVLEKKDNTVVVRFKRVEV